MTTLPSSSRVFNLKPLSRDAVPAALIKAERYRLLNEPGEAESICLDILQVDPANRDATVMLRAGAHRSVSARLVVRCRLARRRTGGRTARRRTSRAITPGSSASGSAKAILQRDRYGAVGDRG